MSAHDPRFAALMQRAPIAMAFVAAQRFVEVSEAFNHLFGHVDDHDLKGADTRSVFVNDPSHKALDERLSASFKAGQAVDDEFELVRRDGSRFWGRIQASPVDWAAAEGESLWVLHDVTAARAARLAPTWTAKHDPVTELSNRREFERRLAEHVGSRRNEPVSVLWVDLDGFGEIVSGMGTDTADHFLYGLGQLFQAKVRASDTVARIEKDRFAVLLPDCDQHYAEIVAEKIRNAVHGFRLRWGLHRARTKASVGVVLLHPTLETPDAVLAAAALACGEAKATGGDCVRIFVVQQPAETAAG